MAERSVLVRLRGDESDLNRAIRSVSSNLNTLRKEIDTTNDRTTWLVQGILALAPAATTLGAAAVPVLSGLATQMTVGAAAAGTMALGFNGVGDALGALNDYQLEPTLANMEKLDEKMGNIGEAGQQFVEFLDSLGPQFTTLSNTARGGMFPGMIEGIEEFMTLMPQLDRVVGQIASGIGDVAASIGTDLAGQEWEEFWEFLENDARPILVELSNTIGNFAQGMGSLIVAFAPVSKSFSTGLEDMSRSFADWAAAVDETQGFQEFLAYVREAGPLALDFLGSLVMAFVELAEAAAPVGAVMLPALTGLLDVIGSLANTPLGPLVIGFTALTAAYGRLSALAAITGSGALGMMTQGIRDNSKAALGAVPSMRQFGNSLDFLSGPLSRTIHMTGETEKHYAGMTARAKEGRTAMGQFGRAAGPIAGQLGLLAVSMSGVDNQLGLTNTTMLTLAGSMLGPWGAAIGASIGLAMDLTAASRETTAAIEGWNTAMDAAVTAGNVDAQAAIVAQARAEVAALTADLADLSFGESITAGVQSKFGLDTEFDDLARLQDALLELESQHEEGKAAADDMGAAIAGIYSGMGNEQVAAARAAAAQENHSAAVREGRIALREARAETRKSAEQFVGLGDKLDKAKVSLGEWLRDLEKQAEALRDFRINAQEAARKGLNEGLIKSLEEAGPAGALRMKQLANATETEIARANRAWQSQRREVRLFTNELTNVPKTKNVELTVAGLKKSITDTRTLYNAMADLRNIKRTITVTTVFTGDGRYFKDVPAGADGMTVPGPRTPYRDQVHIIGAPGEEVVTNRHGEADEFRSVLKGINAGLSRSAIRAMLADGGTVPAGAVAASGSRPVTGAGSVGMDWTSFPVAALGEAIAQLRPMMGSLVVYGDSELARALHQSQAEANGKMPI